MKTSDSSLMHGAYQLPESVRAVERALDLLLCFSQDKPALSLTRLAEQISVPKSTAHRLLMTLENKRFVTRNKSTGLYQLGFRFLEMAAVLREAELEHWAQPYLQALAAEYGETVDLAVLDGAHVIYLQVVESSQRVKLAVAIGQRLPAFCTASGKAFMAFLPAAQAEQILAGDLIKYTEHTKVSRAELEEDLRITRERGFAISEQEYERDINAVAAPILNGEGYPVAVIAIAGPSFRLPRERMLELGQSVLATTEAIAHDVGPAALSAIVSKTVIPGHTGTYGVAGQTEQRG
jgi:IclR family acetate operon transcriptional repressor